MTIFTALGYFACLCQEHAAEGDLHGAIDLLQFFAGDLAVGVPAEQSRIAPAKFGPGVADYPMLGLQIPTTHDLTPVFPVLVEAGALQDDRFVPSHRSHRLLWFRFDRGYAGWVRRALNLDR